MNHINSLVRLIDKGVSIQLMLKDGSMILRFWPQDIIARGSLEAGIVVVRGRVFGDGQAPHDRVVPLCDICGVSGEPSQQTVSAAPGFYPRNAVPRGWITIHARRMDAGIAG